MWIERYRNLQFFVVFMISCIVLVGAVPSFTKILFDAKGFPKGLKPPQKKRNTDRRRNKTSSPSWFKPWPFHPQTLEVTNNPLKGSRELTIPKRSRLESPGESSSSRSLRIQWVFSRNQLARWWQLNYFLRLPPNPRGRWTQFDVCIFFKWVEGKPPTSQFLFSLDTFVDVGIFAGAYYRSSLLCQFCAFPAKDFLVDGLGMTPAR